MHREWNLIFAWQCIYDTVHLFQVVSAFGALESGLLWQIEVIKIISLIYEGLVANQLPIVVYKDSILTLNGKELDKDDYSLSTIGTPTVSSQKGQNKTVLSYQEPGWLFVSLLIPIIVLGVIGLQWLYTKISIKKVA